MFLRSGDLEDKPLEERLVILQFLKQEKEEGLFTADELMDLAASFLGKEIKGGLFEELNHNPPAKSLVEDFANLMGKSYQLTRFGETLESANAQYIAQNQAAGTTMATAMFAGAVSAAVDKLLYGPASISLDPNKRLENIEQQGWDIKGPQSNMKPPEVAGNPDGLAAGTEDVGKIITEIKYKPSSGVIFKANPNKTTTILGNYDRDMKNIINEMGDVKSTYFGEKKGGFNVLNVPNDKYKDADQFWNEHNVKWLDEVIKRGDDIVLATIPEGAVMQSFNKLTREWGPSGFAREYQYLREKGYHYDSTTSMMIK